MTWKDLWTEFVLKFGITINRKPRRINFQRDLVSEFMTKAQIIKGRCERDFEDRLNRRTNITSYLRMDDRLFEPYVDLLGLTIGREQYSFLREIGSSILSLTRDFEATHSVSVNKSHLYFGLSLNSIQLSDTINAMIYWELSQDDESHTSGIPPNATTAINNTINKFSSVINPVSLTLRQNSLYGGLRDNYTFIEDFTDILRTQHPPELFAYMSSALRFRQVDYWLKNNFTAMTKIYSQELINTLCILCEANFKNHPNVTRTMFGEIINHDLITIKPSVAALIGNSQRGNGLFSSYPTRTDADFNNSFQQLISQIKTNTLTEDNLKAHLIYGSYMLRNKSLHDFKSNLVYYNNNVLFCDAIGLLFAAVSTIKNI